MMSRLTDILSGKGFLNFTDDDNAPFYPLESNTRSTREMNRSDYLKLYTGWAYLATSIIASSFASLEHEVVDASGKEKASPYNALITYELLQKISSYLSLNGSCYVWKYKLNNKVLSLEVLRPDILLMEETSDGVLTGYRYTVNGKNLHFTTDEIIAFHNFNPLQAYPFNVKGVSPMQAVAMQMEMDVTANEWNHTFFKNGASVKDVISTDAKVSEESKQRLSTKRKNEFQGVKNAHKVAILDQGLKYSSVSPSQKEMDFVESRRFTRDEVFAIFKVPKSIAGITEDANRATAMVAESIFYKICILPLATMIQEKLNKELLMGDGIFRFKNVVPVDTEQLVMDFNNGAITLNEYRQMRGFQKVKDGDTLKQGFGEPLVIAYDNEGKTMLPSSESTQSIVSKAVNDIILTKTYGTKENLSARDDYGQKVWEQKIQRTDQYERAYVNAIKIIFAEQERDLKGAISKGVTKSYKDNRNDVKYISMRLSLLGPAQKDLIIAEANQAMALVGIETAFKPGSEALDKYMRANITKFAKEVDMTTKQKMFDIIDNGNNNGDSVDDITSEISGTFDQFGRDRANTIARTEVTRASNYAAEEGWKQSGVVNQKERYTSKDERVCEFCGPMNGKMVDLGENFFDKGHNLLGSGGGKLSLDYSSTKGAPLHPRCRCTLLPVVD